MSDVMWEKCDCKYCYNSNDCIMCNNCDNCTNCVLCNNLIFCAENFKSEDNRDCVYCYECTGCKRCNYCVNCVDCKYCIGAYYANGERFLLGNKKYKNYRDWMSAMFNY